MSEYFRVLKRIERDLAENEELLLADGGSKHAEPFKSELNREVGKLIAAKTGKLADLKSPDIVVHLNLEKGEVELQVTGVEILNEAKTPPFYVNDPGAQIDESLRLKYRYLDIRREQMARRLVLRSRLVHAIRDAHHNCIVSNSVSSSVELMPEISVHPA